MIVAGVAFALSFLGIAGLFTLKYWELKRGMRFASRLRIGLDARAVRLKELMVAARVDMSKLPPFGIKLARYVLHRSALAFASLARTAERQAHKLADLVSYKHRFEVRETRSEFLKKVAEHKNGQSGQGNGLDREE